MRNFLSLHSKPLKYLFIVLYGFPVFTFGQSSADISVFKPVQLKKLAQKCELRGDYYTALEYMEEYYRKEQDNPQSNYYLAELYRKSKKYKASIEFYSKKELENKKKFPLRNFHLGSLKMMDREYTEAKKLLMEFRKDYKEGKDAAQYRKLARNYIMGCDSALKADTNKVTAYVYNLGDRVNTSHIEFSPFPLSEDKIIYGSLPIDSANVFSHSKNNAPVRKLFIAEKKGKIWETVKKTEWNINHPEFGTGNAALSPDGQRLYFTRCSQNWKYKTVCKIYVMRKEGGGWGKPQKLNYEINGEDHTATHPAIGTNPKDGSDILYFVSDRPEGKGGFDIWYSFYDKRKEVFKTPKNAGSRVNTYADEITPYFNTATQTLYFSSNGLSGYGGFDVYSIKGYGRKWEEAKNIGMPVNSSYNDTYLALNADGNSGFFTSNRPGSQLLENSTCCDDIYFFNWKLPRTIPAKGLVFSNSDEHIAETIESRFGLNIESVPEGTYLDNVPVYLYQVKESGEKQLIQTTRTENGLYQFNLERENDYEIMVKNYGYLEKTVEATTRRYLSEDTLEIEKAGITSVPEVELTINVYYGTGKSDLTVKDRRLLDTTVVYLLELLPGAIIEIGAHSDNLGKKEFNLKLSQERAEKVAEYLVKRGISEERLVAKGYGSLQPIAPNTFPDGTDNPEGRRKNRRTQIKLIGTLTPEGDIEE